MAAEGTKLAVQYIDRDVYTEAKLRIGHVIDSFDSVVVCFSGGKDSLATLHLVEEVYRERGITQPINVIFRDEELIPDDVITFVLEYAAQTDRFRFWYYAVQLKSHKFILGKTFEYIQWDEARKWIRPKPDIAIVDPKGVVFEQYTMDAFSAKPFRGKVAFLTGVRADESLIRYRSCVNKVNENYINATDSPNVKLVKPIYDWSQNDIFKYFYDKGIRYCPIYDQQVWNNMALRVATPLHAESAKKFGKLRTLYPVFYQQLIDLFPEMLAQERYWDDLDRYGIIDQYPRGWTGILQYIKEHITDVEQRKLAIRRVKDCRTFRENNIANGKDNNNYGGYPILYVFKAVLAGQYKRTIQPVKSPSKDDIEYEQSLRQSAVS